VQIEEYQHYLFTN